jgi:hypothetical protein
MCVITPFADWVKLSSWLINDIESLSVSVKLYKNTKNKPPSIRDAVFIVGGRGTLPVGATPLLAARSARLIFFPDFVALIFYLK